MGSVSIIIGHYVYREALFDDVGHAHAHIHNVQTGGPGRGGWTRPRDVRNNCIPEHGALENVWGKRFFLVLSFTRAPRTEFGETLGRCSR